MEEWMKRREFLKNSAITAGTLLTGAGVGEIKTGTEQIPVEPKEDPSTTGKLVEVPGASFEIVDELTKVPVTVTLGKFLMSPTEVTQLEYEAIIGENPSFHSGANLPVENVTWWDAIRYCNLRSYKENLDPCYNLETGFCDMRKNGYRLPSDTEWTHACQNTSKSPVGNTDANLGNSDTTHVGLLIDELNRSGTKPVGSYPANRYGLYDMFGNVWEWCTDYFNPLSEPQACEGWIVLFGGDRLSAPHPTGQTDTGHVLSQNINLGLLDFASAAPPNRTRCCHPYITVQSGLRRTTRLQPGMKPRLEIYLRSLLE
jgi:formylglycine-generating enzyme required for sulfatase activity